MLSFTLSLAIALPVYGEILNSKKNLLEMMPLVFKVFFILSLACATVQPLSLEAADDPLLEQYFIANAAYNRKL